MKSPNEITKEKQQIADFLKSELRKNIVEAKKNSPLSGTPMEAVIITSSAGNFSESMKKFPEEQLLKFHMSRQEFNALIDDVVSSVLNEFLEY